MLSFQRTEGTDCDDTIKKKNKLKMKKKRNKKFRRIKRASSDIQAARRKKSVEQVLWKTVIKHSNIRICVQYKREQ